MTGAEARAPRFSSPGSLRFGSILGAANIVFELALIAGLYAGLAAASHYLPAIAPVDTPLWPPTGVALAIVLLRGYRIWPAILVGGLIPAVVFSAASFAYPLSTATAQTLLRSDGLRSAPRSPPWRGRG